MSIDQKLPEYVQRLGPDETFTFACHPKVRCFTECCRMLELSLTPYDVLRLRRATGKTSQQLLDEYILIEHDPGEPFPRYYLTMVDDGQASCVFVGAGGCAVYDHRPAACRTYPLGRAVMRRGTTLDEHFVLLREDHCCGFAEQTRHDVASYCEDQQLQDYNIFNDKMATILQHETIRKGYIPPAGQIEDFTLALYNIDRFRQLLENKQESNRTAEQREALKSDEKLLEYAISWVSKRLFETFHPRQAVREQ